MGSLKGVLGLAGGMGGTGFSANSGTNQNQLADSYKQNQQAMQGQQSLLSALQGQGGLQNQSNVYNQLQGVASGQGPNPAMAQLNQATAANTANQAALMAGQRGAGANAGLMARQAGMQGAANQQQAIGQGATMQANQSLNALGQAGNMANTMANQQIGQTNQNVASAQGEQGILQGAHSANNQIQSQLAQGAQENTGKLIGGMMSNMGTAAGMAGGKPPGMASGGSVPPQGPQSMFARSLTMASGGAVPALVSPGEGWLPPEQAQQVAQGKADPLASAEVIPGQAKVKGDSYANDTVPKTLEAGGVVIPRSVMQSKNPSKGAAEFVRAHLAKKKVKK